jgi:HEAT repeat protein
MPLKLSKSVLFRLQGWESRDALPGLTALLASRHNDVKVRACLALESLADPRAVPALIELLSYHDTAVREAAEKALTAIRTIDKKKAEWKKWYEELKRQGGREKL